MHGTRKLTWVGALLLLVVGCGLEGPSPLEPARVEALRRAIDQRYEPSGPGYTLDVRFAPAVLEGLELLTRARVVEERRTWRTGRLSQRVVIEAVPSAWGIELTRTLAVADASLIDVDVEEAAGLPWQTTERTSRTLADPAVERALAEALVLLSARLEEVDPLCTADGCGGAGWAGFGCGGPRVSTQVTIETDAAVYEPDELANGSASSARQLVDIPHRMAAERFAAAAEAVFAPATRATR